MLHICTTAGYGYDFSVNTHSLACVPKLKSNFLASLQRNWPANFFEDFPDLWENQATNHSELYILGDFNLHLDTHFPITSMFVDILTSFDLKHVTFSTHIHGHWLYLLITRLTCNTIKKSTVSDVFSDHQGMSIDINMFITPGLNKNVI